jgi:hypothetical protein
MTFVAFYTVPSAKDNFMDAPLFHVGQVLQGSGDEYNITLGNVSIPFNSSRYSGFIVGLPLGNYSFGVSSSSGMPRCVSPPFDIFVVGSGETFYENVSLCDPESDEPGQDQTSVATSAGALVAIIVSTVLLLLGISVLIVYLLAKKTGFEERKPGYSLVSGMTDVYTTDET